MRTRQPHWWHAYVPDARRWTVFLLRHRRLCVALVCALTTVAAAGIALLHVSYDHRAFFSDTTPRLRHQEQLRNLYGSDRSVFFCVVSRSGTLFTQQNLTSVRTLAAAAEELPRVSDVSSVFSFRDLRPGILGPRLVSVFPDRDTLSADTLMGLARRLTGEPLLRNRLLSRSGHAAGILATVTIANDKKHESALVARRARELADSVSAANPDIDVYVTGGVLLDVAFSEAADDDMRTLGPLMFVAVSVVILLLFRSWRLTAAILAVVVSSTTAAMGVTGWVGIALSPPVAIVPVIVLTVGIADSIHLVTVFLHQRHKGIGVPWSVVAALKQTAVPITVTSLAALAGFLNLNASEVPPFRHMGNAVSVGVVWCYALTLVLLPILLSSGGFGGGRQRGHGVLGSALGRFVSRRATRLSVAVLALTFVALSGIVHIRFDDTFIDYFSTRYRFRRDTDATAHALSGIDYIECSFAAPSKGGLSSPAYLQAIDTLGMIAAQHAPVRHILSLPLVLQTAGSALFIDSSNNRTLLGHGVSTMLIRRMLAESDRNRAFPPLISADSTHTRMLLTLGKVSAHELRTLETDLRTAIEKHFRPRDYTLGGISVLFAHLAQRNTRGMLTGIALTLLVSVFLVTLVTRSWVLGLLSLIPNMVPAAIAAGLWGYFSGTAGMGISVAAAMTLGVIVDDTIHFMYGYFGARRACRCAPREALALAFRHVADAMIATSAILAAGFAMLILSGFAPTANMGILAATVIGCALGADLFLLPGLLVAFSRPPRVSAPVDRGTDS